MRNLMYMIRFEWKAIKTVGFDLRKKLCEFDIFAIGKL